MTYTSEKVLKINYLHKYLEEKQYDLAIYFYEILIKLN